MKRRLFALIALASLGCTARGEDLSASPVGAAGPTREAPVEPGPELTLPLAVPGTSGRIVRFEVAEGVVEHEPRGVATSFSKKTTPRVFAFLEVNNEGGKPFELGVAFDAVGTDEVSTLIPLQIPAIKRWRTQVFMQTRVAGKYRAVVLAENGDELGGRDFDVLD
jgi:hypothetical protein